MARFLSALGMAQVCWWLVSNHLQVRGRLAVLQSCLLSRFQVWPLVNNDKLVEYNFLITLCFINQMPSLHKLNPLWEEMVGYKNDCTDCLGA